MDTDAIRVTAKTVEDALLEAAIELGTSSDNVEYTVIDKGSSGFFGIGGRKAVIEAKRKFTDEDLKKEIFGDQSEKKPKDFKKSFSQDKKEPRKESKKEPQKEQKKEAKKEPKKELKKETKKEETQELKQETKQEAKQEIRQEIKKESKKESRKEVRSEAYKDTGKEEKSPEVSLRKEESRVNREEKKKDRSREGKEDKREASVKETALEQPTEEKIRTPRVPADPEETKRRAFEFLTEVLKVMQIQTEISMEFEDDNLNVNLSGEDMGVLIGKRGQTLDSLQYLTSLVVNKGKASYVRVKLDTEDYRNRRKATLENLAKNIAFKVKKTGKPVFLEPMNPYERRIIHSALQNDSYVTTHSEGEEPYRKVVVTLRREREKEFEKHFERNRDRDRERGSRDTSRYNRRKGRYQDRRERNRYYGQTEENNENDLPTAEIEETAKDNGMEE